MCETRSRSLWSGLEDGRSASVSSVRGVLVSTPVGAVGSAWSALAVVTSAVSVVGDVGQRVIEGTPGIALGVGSAAWTRAVDQLRIDRVGRVSVLQPCTHPRPVLAGRRGVAQAVSALWARGGRGWRWWGRQVVADRPGAAAARGDQDVDPAAAALPVLETGETAEVFTRDRAGIGAQRRDPPALRPHPIRLRQDAVAVQPHMTAARWRGLDEKASTSRARACARSTATSSTKTSGHAWPRAGRI